MTNCETFFLGAAAMLAIFGIKKLVDYVAARREAIVDDIQKVSNRARECEFEITRHGHRFAEVGSDVKFLRESLETAGSTIAGLHDELRQARIDTALLAANFKLCFTDGPHGRALGTTKSNTATELTH
jgi:hypothetical protein